MTNRRSRQTLASAGILLEPGMWDSLRLTWRLARDARVSPMLKLMVPIAVLLYIISPIDLIPDFLLGIGQMDDFGVLGLTLLIAIRLLPRLAPFAVLSEHLTDLGLRAADNHMTFDVEPTRDRYGDNSIETSYRVHDSAGSRR